MNKVLLKILTIVFVVALVFTLNTKSNATELNISVDVPKYLYNIEMHGSSSRYDYNVGETVTFTVNWQENMQASDFTIKYSQAGLDFISASINDYFYTVSPDTGDIVVRWAGLQEEDKTNMEFTFETKAEGIFSFDVDSVRIFANGDLEVPETYNLENSATLINVYIMGDCNNDKVVDNADLEELAYCLNPNNQTLPNTSADVNLDGRINSIDLELITKHINDGIKLPVVYGDINKDGEINIQDLVIMTQIINEDYEYGIDEFVSADINADGYVDNLDKYIMASIVYSDTAIDYYFPAIFGDVNFDGTVDIKDNNRYLKILAGEIQINFIQRIIGDLNSDGVVDNKDTNRLSKYLQGESEIPYHLILKLNYKGKLFNKDTYAGVDLVSTGITKALFMQNYINFPEKYTIKIKDLSGEEIAEDGIIGTGTRVFISYGSEPESEVGRLIIYGDVTGDGIIDAVDALALIKHVNKKIPFTSAIYERAGKIMNTSTTALTAVDALAIVKHANGKYVIDQNI